MTGSMYAAIAGLKTHMQNLNVIGNNVANVNTQGYKSSRAVFKTSIYTSLSGGSNGTATVGGTNPSQIGYGANVSTIDVDMSTGNYSVTGKPTDVMLDGEGFFLLGNKDIAQNFGAGRDDGNGGTVKDPADDINKLTSLTLTRVGDFDFRADGYLCNGDGMCVYGFLCIGTATNEDVIAGKAEKVGDPMFSDQLVPIRKPRVIVGNDGSISIGYPTVDPAVNGGHLMDNGATFTAATDTTPAEIKESELSMAEFTNLSIDKKTGMITGKSKDTGETVTIGCIAVGSVSNPNGVTNLGDNYYQAGPGSGDLTIVAINGGSENMKINYVNGSLYTADGSNMPAGTADVNGFTPADGMRVRSSEIDMLSSGLEMSKTDLAQEIANMIVTQRGYQANTRIITVTDSMLEELVNMKR